jgi:hypothetical protein
MSRTDRATVYRHINALKKDGSVLEYQYGMLRLVYWIGDTDTPQPSPKKAGK